MADTSQVFQTLVTVGFTPTSPGFLNCPLGPSIVRRILITWPAGCGGLVGVQIRAGNGYAFPNQQLQYLSFDDYTYSFDVANQINNGNWRMVVYNVDLIDHEITTVFEYDYLRGDTGQPNSTAVAL